MGEQIGELAYTALLESGALKAENATLRAQLATLAQERDEARAEAVLLREAFTPIACEMVKPDDGDEVPLELNYSTPRDQDFTVGDFRRARAALATPPAQLAAVGQQQDEAAATTQRLREACEKAMRLILEADATTEESNYARATAHIRILLCAALANATADGVAELLVQAKAQGAAEERERAVKVMCYRCRLGGQPELRGGKWGHRMGYDGPDELCGASALRALPAEPTLVKRLAQPSAARDCGCVADESCCECLFRNAAEPTPSAEDTQ